MAGFKLTARVLFCTLALAASNSPGELVAAEFSAEATALPYPPDARELEFVAWAGDVKYRSSSPLKSLAAFYLKHMPERGWELDESATEIDDDSIELTFKHGDAKVELDLSQWSKEVHVSLDCDGIKFTDTDDPARLAAAGIPVPRAALFLQKEIPLPEGTRDLQYDGDGCTFKSTMTLSQAFDHFTGIVRGKGFRESRRPIVTETRRYTEFRKGAAELSVNVFTDEVGSRIVLEYADGQNESPVRPLPAVASLDLKNPASPNNPAGASATPAAAGNAIDVTKNKGTATVTFGDMKYTFSHVASYQTKSYGAETTFIVFASRAMPLKKLQSLAQAEEDFSFSDLYEFNSPDYLQLQLGKDYVGLSLSVPGIGIGDSVENSTNEIKLAEGRVKGSFKMLPQEILGRQLSFTATIDAAVITPQTRITGPSDPVPPSSNPLLAESPIPLPEGAELVNASGSRFRKTYSATVARPLAEVASFYQTQLAEKGWTAVATDAAGPMNFKTDAAELSISLEAQGDETAITAVHRDAALARQQGILPEPGKGRLVLANAHTVAVLYTIGNIDYPLKPGQGAEDFKQALNYSIPPGTYKVVVKIPGEAPQTERIELTAGSSWGIIALPTGGYMPLQLY